ncbi:hypothetical protein D3C81_1669040 [compost metagenome]
MSEESRSNLETSINSTDTIYDVPSNLIGKLLYATGITIIVVGVVVGLIIGLTLKDPLSSSSYFPDPHPLRWVYGLSIIISSSISGLLFLGISEVIKLLSSIRNNTNK